MTKQSKGFDPENSETLDPPAVAALEAEIHAEHDGSVQVRQFVTFHLDAEVFALDMAQVREIIRVPEVTRVPLAPAALDGVANMRGAVVPIVSLRRMLGLEEREADEATRAMVADVGQPMGFVVDRVSSVVGVEAGQIEESTGGSSAIDADYLSGMIKDAGGHAITMIVDFTRLIEREFALIAEAAQCAATVARGSAESDLGDDERMLEEIQLVNFVLDGQEFGIAIDDVQEIVHLPDAITSLPKTPAHVLGVTTLRRRLLPLMDLRAMFHLPLRALDEKSRVVVLRLGGLSVGLVVDTVSEVLRVGLADVRDLPALVATEGEDSEITRVCQLQHGKRLVSIVNAPNLFEHPAVRAALRSAKDDDQPDSEEEMEAQAVSDDGRQMVVFRLGDEEYGVPIGAVKEILRVPDDVFWVPRSASWVEGVINLRGSVLPVIDLRVRMGLERVEANERQRIMVLHSGGGATGFVVDHVAQVLVVPEGAIEDAPQLSDGQSRLLPRVANLVADGRLLQLLAPERLLEGDDRLLPEAA